MTHIEINEIMEKYRKYLEIAEKYYTAKTVDKYPKIRLDEWGNIQHEINDSCNCHPEYIWEQYASVEDVVEWLEQNPEKS